MLWCISGLPKYLFDGYTNSYFNTNLDQQAKDALLNVYKMLPAFDDVKEGLIRANKAGFRLYAFSNGTAEAVEKLLAHAGISEHFLDIVSVDELKTFKPNPDVYHHFLKRAGTVGTDAWLISCNPFDVLGAISAGMFSAWVQRTPEALFDPWGILPTITVSNLANLADEIIRMEANSQLETFT